MGLVTITTIVQVDAARPKLVVGIVVDQLRTDCLESLKSVLGEKGFKRLMEQGAYMRDVDFVVAEPDAVSATAMIYTGNYPSKNGVVAAEKYNPAQLKVEPILHDPNSLGNFTNETYSPRNIVLSTISD